MRKMKNIMKEKYKLYKKEKSGTYYLYIYNKKEVIIWENIQQKIL